MRNDSFSSAFIPKFIVPRQSRLTLTPDFPSFVNLMWRILSDLSFFNPRDARASRIEYDWAMDRFQTIVIPEPDSRLRPFVDRLRRWAREVRTFDTPVGDSTDLSSRIGDADVVLPMGGTRLTAEVINAAQSLRYIGLGATLFSGIHSNIDLEAAAARSIPVTGVRDYGDIGVAEWVVAEAVRFVKRPELNGELAGTPVGIIGAGAAGGLTARSLAALGADVRYTGRGRKHKIEADGIPYQPLDSLLSECLIVSIHLPRNTMIVGARELELFGAGKLLINTSVGLPVEVDALSNWLNDPNNLFAADIEGIGALMDTAATHPRISYLPATSGYTAQAAERLYAEVERQLVAFLQQRTRPQARGEAPYQA